MRVYLDDSGDAGLKIGHGSSRWIVMTACVFEHQWQVDRTLECIEKARILNQVGDRVYRLDREFKFNKTKNEYKERFFSCLQNAPFHARTVVFDKQNIRSRHLLEAPNDIKSWLIMQLLSHNDGTITAADLYIDGQDTRAFKAFYNSDRDYLMNKVNAMAPSTLRSVHFVDSKKEPLIQLADMMSGLMHSYQDQREHDRKRRLFELAADHFHKPGDIWFLR